jgi:NADP-reducing hydrogenase subunit HndB
MTMAKLKIEDLQKIKERVHAETALRDGCNRAKVTVHMGTCGIASGAKDVMDALLQELEEAGKSDVMITTSGCMGLCSREPLVTVEIIGQEPIKYEYINPNKMRQIFKKHILAGEIQTPFVLARGAEIIK